MDDLISRAAVIELIENRQRELCPVGMFGRNAVYGTDREKFDHWQEIIDEIECLPIMDAVPVVKCKDCKYWKDQSETPKWLPCSEIRTNGNWFCADGERRDD